MSPLRSPNWHGNSVTQRVTHPPQTKPVMKHFIQSRVRLTQAPKKLCNERHHTLHRAQDPILSSQPGSTPPQPRVALAWCRQQPGASESQPSPRSGSPAQTLRHVIPRESCCQNCSSAAPKRQEENPAGRRGRVQGGQAGPTHTTQPLHPPWGDRKVALGAISHMASRWQ